MKKNIILIAAIALSFQFSYASPAVPEAANAPDAPDTAKIWNDTSTDFNAAGSWTGGSPSGNNVARFDTAFGTNQPTLTADISTSGILFNGAAVSGYTVGGAFTLTLTGYATSGSSGTSNSSAAAIRGSNTSGTNTIGANILLSAASGTVSTFVQVSGGTLIINGAISSSSTSSLSLRNGATGGGTIQLNGANAHTTGTSIDSSDLTVVLGNNSALGTGAFDINATSTIEAGGGSRTIGNATTLNGTATIGGSNALTFSGSVTAAGAVTRTLTVNNTAATTLGGNVFLSDAAGTGRTLLINGTGDVTVNGVISNFNGAGTAGTLSHGGSGVLTLNSANTYSGGTLMSGGTTIANVDGAFGSGNVSLTAAAVTLTLQTGATNNYIADSATFNIGFTDDVVNLSYSGTDTINMLIVNGTTMQPGVYGSGDLPELFGTGTLTVLIPEPSTWAMLVVGAGLLAGVQRFRRKQS